MSRSLRSSLFYHLDFDLREITNPLKAISLQRKRNKDSGISDPPVFLYVERARSVRALRQEIARENKPRFLRDFPENRNFRVFMQAADYQCLGPKRRKLLGRFARNWASSEYLAPSVISDFSAANYFSLLFQNEHISDTVKRNLMRLQIGTNNRGPGLGSTNERRAALALSILADKKLIVGFQICGEAGKPLMTKSKITDTDFDYDSIDYSAHEEAMAVDILVQLKSFPENIYLPLQIKSSGPVGYDRAERYLTFNSEERTQLESFMPEVRDLFVEDHRKSGKYRLKFQRKVLKLGLNERKIVKSDKKDFEPDIANKIMAMIEYAIDESETLTLGKPYKQHSYVDKVISMIKSGFLTPITDSRHELDF